VPPRSDILAENHANWLSQVKRGILELCILNLLERQAMYGYQIVKRLTAIPGLIISEGTIYPLLARLKGLGFLKSQLIESPQGPARRTYVLTLAGRSHLQQISQGWRDVVHAVDECQKEPENTRETNP
jgi:PadR family transcriptional regulator PadR